MSRKKEEKTTVCQAAITLMTFGPGYEQIAFVPNNHQIKIANVPKKNRNDCTKFEIINTLEEHCQLVSGLAWGHKTNKILSCAHDRTAFVWSQDEESGDWIPVHVLLDAAVKRGLTSCSWNPKEDRAFIASAAFNVAVGKDDAPNPFWSCVVVAPHVSTITCVASHPLIERTVATGSSDTTVKITVTKGRNPQAECVLKAKGWILDLQWSPNGNALAFSTQCCEVHVATGSTSDWSSFTVTGKIRLPGLPLRSICWVHDTLLIGGGFESYPIAMTPVKTEGDDCGVSGPWRVEGKFAGKPKALKKEKTAAELAREKFENEAKFGQQQGIEIPETKHTNTISKVIAITGTTDESAYSFATSSMDGRIEFWKMEEMQP